MHKIFDGEPALKTNNAADISDICTRQDKGENETQTPAPAASNKPQSNTPANIALAKAGLVSALAVATAACGGGGSGNAASGDGGTAGGGGSPAPTVVKPQTDEEAARFLLHASLFASPDLISAVKTSGYEPWLNTQMSANNSQSAEQFIRQEGLDQVTTDQNFFRSSITDLMVWNQLLNGGSSVRKRAALALSEFFVVSANSVSITWPGSAMGAYWDILNDNAFGNFRDLLEAITLNPAMGVFLNTRGNRKADQDSGRVPDENFGREVMQLFSIGLFELNNDGTIRTNGAEPIETYTNDDVTGIAKVFTGYDYDATGINFTPSPNNPNSQIPDAAYARNPMTADPARWRFPRSEGFHSDSEKTFLGTTIPAGTGAEESLRIALDTLFNHPNVGPFFGKQMIQRLVTSNPSPAYVSRVANAFNNNGSGTRGDLRAVFKAVLLDDEALAPGGLTDGSFGKLREPMLRFTQWARTAGVRSTSGESSVGNLSDAASRLGQSPLRSPSVFNFFRPGYSPPGTQTSEMNLLAPEFQIVNETSVAGYINFMERSIDMRGFWLRDYTASYAGELDVVENSETLLDRLDLLLTAGQLTSGTRELILGAMNDIDVTATSDDETKLRRIHIGTLLVMASNEYMIQR